MGMIPEGAAYDVTVKDGQEFKDMYQTRLTGFDTTAWFSNGVVSVPVTAILFITKQ